MLDIAETDGQITVTIANPLPRGYRGCAILAVLARPPRRAQDADTLAAFHVLVRMLYVAVEGHGAPTGGVILQSVLPAAAMLPSEVAGRRFRRLHKAMDERLAAAHAMAPEFRAAEGRMGSRPERRAVRTQADAGLATLEDDLRMRERMPRWAVGDLAPLPADAVNFQSRALRPSLPVIHLAFAAVQLVEEGSKALLQGPVELQERYGIRLEDGGFVGGFLFGTLLNDDDFGELLLKRAERREALLPWLNRPRVMNFVRLRLEPQGRTAADPQSTDAGTVASKRLPSGVAIDVPRWGGRALTAAMIIAAASCVPEIANDPTLGQEVAALARLAWQRRLQRDPLSAHQLVVGDLRHFAMPLARAHAIETRIKRALRVRFRAVRILAPAVQATFNAQALPGADDGKAWSLAGAVRRILEQDAIKVEVAGDRRPRSPPTRSQVSNAEARVIAPSRKVLHLATAILFELQQMARRSGRILGPADDIDIDIASLIDAPDWADAVLALAAELEEATCALPAGGPSPDTIVRVRII